MVAGTANHRLTGMHLGRPCEKGGRSRPVTGPSLPAYFAFGTEPSVVMRMVISSLTLGT